MPQSAGMNTRLTPHARLAWIHRMGLAVAALYALVAATAMLSLSPRVPYADTWHFDTQLLSHPFPGNVLMVDNGHAQIIPRLLRWLELTQWHGNQWPTIIAGMLCLAAALLMWITTRATPDGPAESAARADYRLTRAAWLLTGVVGLCWLGNGRTLAHGNEAIHSYLIIACMLGAVRLAIKPGRTRMAAALALALLAALTFGTGAAAFVAIAVVLILRRANWRALLATLGVALLAAALYLLLPSAASGTRVIALHPVLQLSQLARWLGSPWLLAGGPLVDASVVNKLPAATRPLAAPFAHVSTALFGPARTAVWPELGLGLAGILVLAWLSWQCWRRTGRQNPVELLALGCAWFALGCGMLVVLARTDYFLQHPDQIYASRYAVWYTLFWCGLLGAALWRLHAAGRSGSALALALTVAIGLLPGTGWNAVRAIHMSRIAVRDALGVRVGVIDQAGDHGENRIGVMRRARPLLLAARTSIFTPTRGPLVGSQLDPETPVRSLHDVSWRAVANALEPAAARIGFSMENSNQNHLLLVNARNRIIGEARRAPGQNRWQGWVIGPSAPKRVQGVRVADAIVHTSHTPGDSTQ